MSYANFKPVVWSKHIQHELEKITVFKEDCDYQFQGEVGHGKRVKILGVGRPTIGDYTGEKIGAPETVADTSVYLDIDQAKFFNFGVDDVDKAQAQEGLMAALMDESARALAEDTDTWLAKNIAMGAGKKSAVLTVSTPAEAKAAVDGAFTYLWGNGVKFTDKVTMYLPPWFYLLFQQYMIENKTDNDTLLAKGIVGSYNSAKVKLTNNLYADSNGCDHIIVKTSKGFAFADGINNTEAYRPDELFKDAVKGLHTYGGKAVRPKEIYVIKAKAAE